MPVQLVTTPSCIVTGNTFKLVPAPNYVKYVEETRPMGIYPWLYEIINPSTVITAIGVGGCPEPNFPELITGIRIEGTGCSILKIADVAYEQGYPIPQNIPEMTQGFSEPFVEYGSIVSAPVPSLSLVNPLIGYYSEKYFHDSEWIFGTFYETETERLKNNFTSVDLLRGWRKMNLEDIPPEVDQLTSEDFPGQYRQLEVNKLAVLDPTLVETKGTDFFDQFEPEISLWVRMKPSLIELMQYQYLLTVTHTCPPFVTTFTGTMDVVNNWTPTANRIGYWLDRAVGFLPPPPGVESLLPGVND